MIKKISTVIFIQLFVLLFVMTLMSVRSYAATCPDGSPIPDNVPLAECDQFNQGSGGQTPSTTSEEPLEFATVEGQYQCGTGGNAVKTGLNLGCKGAELESQGKTINPIVDMAFALFRVLSAGVGLIVIGSIVVAGIQYTASRGNPQATQAAISRVSSSVVALIMYMLIFALANYLVPGGMFI